MISSWPEVTAVDVEESVTGKAEDNVLGVDAGPSGMDIINHDVALNPLR
jgi:hypothetical protein